MSETDAAEYVGVSLAQFRRERQKGLWPAPVPRGARVNTYDREALDNAVDRLSGRINHPDPEIDLPEFGPGCGASELYRRPMSKTTLTPFNEETAARP
jgi:hypothetical protein